MTLFRPRSASEEKDIESPTVSFSNGVSFTVVETGLSEKKSEEKEDSLESRIKFTVKDDPRSSESMLLVTFPPGEPAAEYDMKYDPANKEWQVEIKRSANAGELFYILKGFKVSDDAKIKMTAPVMTEGLLALKDGHPLPVNPIPGVPRGELKNFLLSADGSLSPVTEEKPDPGKLAPGQRFVKVYLPPDYEKEKETKKFPLQITLDGRQYLDIMHMHTVWDNLIARGEMEPTIGIFISPESGAPDEKAISLPPVVAEGYPFSMRLKEYCCNPEFSDVLAKIPAALLKDCGLAVSDDRHDITLWGMSASGLAVVYAALLHPDVFGNVVSQSPMAWNIPIQHGKKKEEDWRKEIKDIKDSAGENITWTTATAPLPAAEEEHKEYITQMVRSGSDEEISGREIVAGKDKSVRFYFDAGKKECTYDARAGTANLVEAAELLVKALEEKKSHTVVDGCVHMLPGGHHNMTWMHDIPAISRALHAPRSMPDKKRDAEEEKKPKPRFPSS